MIDAITTDGRAVVLNEDGSWQFGLRTVEVAGEGFGGVSWGEPQSKVETLKSEGGWILSTDELLMTEVFILEWVFNSTYQFTYGLLTRGSYRLDTESFGGPDADLYRKISQILRTKYGLPDLSNVMQGESLLEGDLSLIEDDEFMTLTVFESWETAESNIILYFQGREVDDEIDDDPYAFDDDLMRKSPAMTVSYESRKLKTMVDQAKYDEALKML